MHRLQGKAAFLIVEVLVPLMRHAVALVEAEVFLGLQRVMEEAQALIRRQVNFQVAGSVNDFHLFYDAVVGLGQGE